MERLVIDHSLVLAWGFNTPDSHYADRLLTGLTRMELLAPPIWPLEMTRALDAALQEGWLPQSAVEGLLELLDGLPIRISDINPSPRVLLHLVHGHGVTPRDAIYLHLCRAENLPLASLDRRLLAAARRCEVAVHGSLSGTPLALKFEV